MACREAVRKASGKKRPPIHSLYFCKFEQLCRSSNCSKRFLKSDNHSVTVIVSCTEYFLHCLGTASVLKSEINSRVSFVDFALPSHKEANNLRSARTLPSTLLPWPISRSKQRQRESCKDESVLDMMATVSGNMPKMPLTFMPNSVSGLATSLERRFCPAFLCFGTGAAEACKANHLAMVWLARLMRNICSACTGKPIQVGSPFAGRSSIHCKNCSRFRASGATRSCSFASVMFNLKSALKLSSRNK
mmetsp:Transcript_110735/g.352714  ORF Transcript_110735/g.352714 Transcript_110735/m.352714 type:complete len:247 (-) Transcript_110735:12778-13518(-)